MSSAITGSRVHRAWKCPASVVLPQAPQDDRHEPARRRGKQIHAFLERVGVVGRDVALGECEDDALLPLLKSLDLDELPVHLATEVAYAWNWQARLGRELGRNLDRAYGSAAQPPDLLREIPLTIDIVGSAMAAHIGFAADYKSGHSRYPPPDQFGQTLVAALCVRDVLQVDEVVVQLIHIHDDGGHHKATRTVDGWQLDAFMTELESSMSLVRAWEEDMASGRRPEPEPAEGPWCDHCPAFHGCPAKLQLVRQLPAELTAIGIKVDDGGKLTVDPRAMTAARAAASWMALERIEDVIAAAKQELCHVAAFHDIPLPDGRVLGRVQTERRKVDGRIAGEIIERRYGRAERDRTIAPACSLDALHQLVVRNIRPGEKIGPTKRGDGVLDRLIAEIEAKGGVDVVTTDAIKPHKPKR